MLPLDDIRWRELGHAYGSASDLPDLIRFLASSPGPTKRYRDDPWFGLWSRLCHQGDVYTASYAAVPHIVEIARRTTQPVDSSFFHLPAAVEVARLTGRGPEIPGIYADAYHRSLLQLGENVHLHRHEVWDQSMLLSATAAQAVAKGHVVVAQVLLNLDADWISRITKGEFG